MVLFTFEKPRSASLELTGIVFTTLSIKVGSTVRYVQNLRTRTSKF